MKVKHLFLYVSLGIINQSLIGQESRLVISNTITLSSLGFKYYDKKTPSSVNKNHFNMGLNGGAKIAFSAKSNKNFNIHSSIELIRLSYSFEFDDILKTNELHYIIGEVENTFIELNVAPEYRLSDGTSEFYINSGLGIRNDFSFFPSYAIGYLKTTGATVDLSSKNSRSTTKLLWVSNIGGTFYTKNIGINLELGYNRTRYRDAISDIVKMKMHNFNLRIGVAYRFNYSNVK